MHFVWNLVETKALFLVSVNFPLGLVVHRLFSLKSSFFEFRSFSNRIFCHDKLMFFLKHDIFIQLKLCWRFFSMKKNLCHVNHSFPKKYFTFEHFFSIKFDFEPKWTMSRSIKQKFNRKSIVEMKRATQCAMQYKTYLSSVFYLEMALKNEKHKFRNWYSSQSQ